MPKIDIFLLKWEYYPGDRFWRSQMTHKNTIDGSIGMDNLKYDLYACSWFNGVMLRGLQDPLQMPSTPFPSLKTLLPKTSQIPEIHRTLAKKFLLLFFIKKNFWNNY
jgi:hypothetical protein